MFKKQDNETKDTVDTIIGPSVSVEGDFKGEGNIVVEGEVRGSLKTKGYLKVVENANILAGVNASNAEVAGRIVGNVKIKDHLDIKQSAVIEGDVETKTISIAYGAIVNGNLKMKSAEQKIPEKQTRDESGAQPN